MKKIILFFIFFSIYSFSQENRLVRQNELSDSLDVVRTLIPNPEPLQKIYGIITNGSVTTWDIFGFTSDATNVISGDTLIITDASGELNLEGIIFSNNYDFTIVGTPTIYQIKIEWGGFTGKTISFIWELDTLSASFTEYSGTSNSYVYNYTLDTTNLSNRIDAIADSNFVLTSETFAWDKNASDDALFYTGTDSIHYGQDSIVVAHGVGSTPSFISIQLVSDGFGFQTWVSGINSLTFYVRRSDVGLETITSYIKFKWMAYK